jgi:hypothetical protein
MRGMRSVFVCLALAGCAQASGTPGDDVTDVDASVRRDTGAVTDASNVDAPPAPCTNMTKNLLRNGTFETAPAGVDWNATPIDSTLPIVTDDAGGVAAQSPTFRAWMGGLEEPAATNKDVLYQDVAVPPMTTKLEFKGFYEIRTGEIGTNIYDRATVELTSMTNTQLELIKALDDNGATTAWTPFNKLFTGMYSGMTIRLRVSTASDSFDPTSFFFDGLELNATFCQ